ncbi:sugar O-acetyltransferase [Lacticaseibacillus suihuaensis]
MTEQSKMLAGQLYDAMDPALATQRRLARQAADAYNATQEGDDAKRHAILAGLLGHLGDDCELNPSVRFDYGENLYLGDHCYFNFDCIFLDCAEIRFGDNVFVGPRCSFLTPVHPLQAAARNRQFDAAGQVHLFESAQPITVESNVWLGGGVTVNPGVTIHHDAVVGSGAVVTKDVEAFAIVAGVPAKVIGDVRA